MNRNRQRLTLDVVLSAYGAVANDGVHCPPYAIAEVRDRDGNVLVTGGGCLPTMSRQRFMTRAIGALVLDVEDFGASPPLPREGAAGEGAASQEGDEPPDQRVEPEGVRQ